MKEFMRSIASYASVYGGLTALGRRFGHRDGTLIVYGHRVAGDAEGYLRGVKPEWLEEQLAYLARHYRFLALSELVGILEQGKRAPERSVVVTMDDGFRDNYAHGFPLFQKYGVPATVFLATGCLDSGELPWSQRLGCLFQQTRVPEFSHPLLEGAVCPLSSASDRKQAYNRVKEHLKMMGRDAREKVLWEVSAALQTEAPRDRMMTWDMAREMMAAGMEMGGHTVSHPLLANLEAEEAEAELRVSKDRLREELGLENPTFCFPVGSWNPRLVELARSLGYRSVFTSRRDVRWNQSGKVTPFSLSRIGLPNTRGVFLHAEVDGPLHGLRMAMRARMK